MKVKINLDKFSTILQFVKICEEIDAPVYLTDGNHYRVSAKSLIGAMATVEWDELWCECETDIFMKLKPFVVEE